jgi:hypothetical protein
MKSRSWALLGLTLLVGLSAAGFSHAQDAAKNDAAKTDATQTDASKPEAAKTDPAKTCDVPAYLLNSESALPKVAAAVKNGQPLTILVVGSRSSTILSSEANAYPARLLAALKEKLPQVAVNLSVELQASKSLLWLSGRPVRSMLCDRSIPTIFAALSMTELLRCKIREPTWFWLICNTVRAPRR